MFLILVIFLIYLCCFKKSTKKFRAVDEIKPDSVSKIEAMQVAANDVTGVNLPQADEIAENEIVAENFISNSFADRSELDFESVDKIDANIQLSKAKRQNRKSMHTFRKGIAETLKSQESKQVSEPNIPTDEFENSHKDLT